MFVSPESRFPIDVDAVHVLPMASSSKRHGRRWMSAFVNERTTIWRARFGVRYEFVNELLSDLIGGMTLLR